MLMQKDTKQKRLEAILMRKDIRLKRYVHIPMQKDMEKQQMNMRMLKED